MGGVLLLACHRPSLSRGTADARLSDNGGDLGPHWGVAASPLGRADPTCMSCRRRPPLRCFFAACFCARCALREEAVETRNGARGEFCTPVRSPPYVAVCERRVYIGRGGQDALDPAVPLHLECALLLCL